MTSAALCDTYDCALFDLDGVVYLGPEPVEGAPDGIGALRDRGVRVGFVTNNAARPPRVVSDQLTRIGIPSEATDIVTSAQAAAAMLRDSLDPGAKVLVVGTQALADEVSAVGLTPVPDRSAQPVAVVQGYDPDMTWPRVTDAVHAIQAGAEWYASNLDPTRPTDLGLEPGVGSQIAAIGCCFPERIPEVAGKPYPPLLRETIRRLGGEHPIFVGDRLDTDIEGARRVDMASMLVFTGAHGMYDLVDADPIQRPDHIGYDLRALLHPSRVVSRSGNQVSCAGATVSVDGGVLTLNAPLITRDEQLDALWAVLALVWQIRDAGGAGPDVAAVLQEFTLLH
ncbi:HAD-IIA family hydrolase [Propionibacterium sp.]|uniref:HAD-IIA family hydrolase n=1 Tax=Propionibacterium sp. TaxID=1977903 RepID=UPI0039EC86CA